MGRLYVVPTPIGNLADITVRALEVLGRVPVVLAEDTRRTAILLRHYQITTRLLSYHQHNKQARLAEALALLHDGDLALVSDAGSPSIADPGFELIRAAIDAGLDLEVLPGPSAVITAVTWAALPAPGFLFLGFLPRRTGERVRRLQEVAALPFSLVFFEAPHRLVDMLADVVSACGEDRPVVVLREMTKIHGEAVRGRAAEMQEHFLSYPPRGEIAVVVGASAPPEPDLEAAVAALRNRQEAGESRRDAVAAVAADFGVARNVLSRLWLEAIDRR